MARNKQGEGAEGGAEVNAEAAPTVEQVAKAMPTSGYRFKGGAKEKMHPFLQGITLDHLKDPKIIAAIHKLDAKGTTKGYFAANIEPA